MRNLQSLLKLLVHSPIEFVLVGGYAAILHGANQTTRDIDICILYSVDQIQRLRSILASLHPRYRIDSSPITSLHFAKKFESSGGGSGELGRSPEFEPKHPALPVRGGIGCDDLVTPDPEIRIIVMRIKNLRRLRIIIGP